MINSLKSVILSIIIHINFTVEQVYAFTNKEKRRKQNVSIKKRQTSEKYKKKKKKKTK